MNESTPTITRYLLGELPEGERSALEERYFADPRVFDEITAAETALVDDYVRGRLPADLRRRFEQTYLTDARRRNRVRFAETLAARVDQSGEPSPGRASWLGVLWPPTPRLGFAVATVLLVSTGIWLAIQTSPVRQESAQVDGGRATEVERPPPGPADPPPLTRPSQPGPTMPSFVTLFLAVGGGERGQDAARPPTLVIPSGTSEVRLQLRLREHEHASYQVVVRAIGGLGDPASYQPPAGSRRAGCNAHPRSCRRVGSAPATTCSRYKARRAGARSTI